MDDPKQSSQQRNLNRSIASMKKKKRSLFVTNETVHLIPRTEKVIKNPKIINAYSAKFPLFCVIKIVIKITTLEQKQRTG